ncbi:PAS domain-containing sensor histidine kinase [Rhodonellum sp.]|uniref:PAS domain-containing sensor histidine kinase n=1 Tax=Rhodonellum sp. TaxID=2231180 RepID=UPI00271D3EDC|nr:PAS domain-containing sensor histidine kinase [Rhodonellum sp.]MDO9554930.1 PAS domain-containing sensor histidine kinase [Rhodonellum sp.]
MDYLNHSQLYERAEEILQKKTPKINSLPTEADAIRLIHELEVYQIELELQNEELKLAKLQSEGIAQKYTSLYDFAPIGYFTLSNKGIILEMNLSGAKMLGKTRSALKNTPFYRYIPNEENLVFNLFLEKAFESKTKGGIEIGLLGSGDSPIYTQLTIVVDKGNEDQCLLTVTDITDKQLNLEELKINLEKEIELNQLKSKFISMTSHELRTPLAIILSSADLMKMFSEGVKEEKVKEGLIRQIKKIDIQIGRLNQIISDVVLLEKNNEGKLTFRQMDVDIKSLLLHLALNQFGLDENDSKIQLDLGIEPVFVKSDLTSLSHVFRNLIGNALKYTPVGSPKPILKMIPKEKWVEIQIEDFGIGIPQDEKKFIFDAFFRASNVSNIKGTGLGLSIVKDLVKNLGGKINFSSTEKRGSVFAINLPYERENIAD